MEIVKGCPLDEIDPSPKPENTRKEPLPTSCPKFLAKRFKQVPTPVLVERLLKESDYAKYYPEHFASGLRRERVLELLEKAFRGESLMPKFTPSVRFHNPDQSGLPQFPGDPDDHKK